MAEQYFNLNFYDPAVPAFCSFDKMYVGTIDEIRVVMNRLAKTKDYVGTVKAWKAYCTGDHNAIHNVAYRDIPLLTPVEYVSSSQLTIPGRTWEHINTWGWPYVMKISEGRISQVIVKHEGQYVRMLRAWLGDLCYESFGRKWVPLTGGFWGNDFVLDVIKRPGKHFTFNNLLYIEEDSSDDLAEFEDKLLNPEALIFDKICDEIFADG